MKHWRQAATVILTASNRLLPSSAKSSYNYKVLFVQRSRQSSIFPNVHALPGGSVDKSDWSQHWAGLLSQQQQPVDQLLASLTTRHRAETYDNPEGSRPGDLPAEIALRICALRETFEETGILIMQNKHGEMELLHDVLDESMLEWRAKLCNTNEGGEVFPQLCEHLLVKRQLTLNICSLHEWCSWLTPLHVGRGAKGRFDTMFFIVALTSTGAHLGETMHTQASEVRNLVWMSPGHSLQLHTQRPHGVELAPPQVYEMGRLYHFVDIHQLNTFAAMRSSLGCQRWMPVAQRLQEVDAPLLVTLPGDERHPSQVDYLLPHSSFADNGERLSLQEVSQDQRFNRWLMPTNQKGVVAWWDANQPMWGHLTPVRLSEFHEQTLT